MIYIICNLHGYNLYIVLSSSSSKLSSSNSMMSSAFGQFNPQYGKRDLPDIYDRASLRARAYILAKSQVDWTIFIIHITTGLYSLHYKYIYKMTFPKNRVWSCQIIINEFQMLVTMETGYIVDVPRIYLKYIPVIGIKVVYTPYTMIYYIKLK